MRTQEDIEKSKSKLRASQGSGYARDMTKMCPSCNIPMVYIYGETFECPMCKRKELTDFGKIREFLDENGPKPAMVISEATNVDMDVINVYLRQGRVEIPDGSGIYIRCESCGTDIRYGRFCPECAAKASKDVGMGMLSADMGEKPTARQEMSGKMHIKNVRLKQK
jgi:Zn-finger nucleic acid-binding protein